MYQFASLAPLCIHYSQRGTCRFGTRCKFRHGDEDAGSSIVEMPFHHRQFCQRQDGNDNNVASIPTAAVAPSSSQSSSPLAQSTKSNHDAEKNSDLLRIMTYNILADQYAHEHSRDLYSAVPRSAIDWATRCPMIAQEIGHWRPDVVCFQEVDHFDDVQSLLRPLGYKGMFTQRTGGRPDGLAMFWNKARLSAEAVQTVEFASLGLKDNVCQLAVLRQRSSSGSSSSSGNKTNNNKQKALLVANIHVLFNPKRGDIKVAQVRTMLEAAHDLVSARRRTHLPGPCPIVVCGDFNSAVNSPLYTFVVEGELDLTTTDRRRLSGQVEVAGRSGWGSLKCNFLLAMRQGAVSEEQALAMALGAIPPYNSMTDPHSSVRDPLYHMNVGGGGNDVSQSSSMVTAFANTSINSTSTASTKKKQQQQRGWAKEELEMAVGHPRHGVKARHPLKLASAYHDVAGTEPMYTTVHDKYVGTVDYIFYDTDSGGGNDGDGDTTVLRPVRVLEPPLLQNINEGLPSGHWPSDHICLVADFEYTLQ